MVDGEGTDHLQCAYPSLDEQLVELQRSLTRFVNDRRARLARSQVRQVQARQTTDRVARTAERRKASDAVKDAIRGESDFVTKDRMAREAAQAAHPMTALSNLVQDTNNSGGQNNGPAPQVGPTDWNADFDGSKEKLTDIGEEMRKAVGIQESHPMSYSKDSRSGVGEDARHRPPAGGQQMGATGGSAATKFEHPADLQQQRDSDYETELQRQLQARGLDMRNFTPHELRLAEQIAREKLNEQRAEYVAEHLETHLERDGADPEVARTVKQQIGNQLAKAAHPALQRRRR